MNNVDSYVQEYGSVDVLLTATKSIPTEIEIVPALVGAAGRFGQSPHSTVWIRIAAESRG
jgi:hypothetical protein